MKNNENNATKKKWFWIRGRFALPFKVHLELECTEEQSIDPVWLGERLIEAGRREFGDMHHLLEDVFVYETISSEYGPIPDEAVITWGFKP